MATIKKNNMPKNNKKPNWFKRLPNNIKGIVKELKRIRWIKQNDAWKTLGLTLIFVSISSVVLFLITIIFTALWNSLGVGL